jgi:hypothetical protein
MPLPETSRLEIPILLELKALGGESKPHPLYRSLTSYFPSLTAEDLRARTPAKRFRWRLRVQTAAGRLARKGEIDRESRRWTLTDAGKERAETEDMPIQLFLFSDQGKPPLSHNDIRHRLMKIGEMLGKYSREEYRDGPRRYDVVWKESHLSPRISHVFEVQNKGSLENGLANLKHAYDTQRSKPFLIIADEVKAGMPECYLLPHLMGSFHEIGDSTVILSGQDIQRIYQSLVSVNDLLNRLLEE